MHAQVNFVPGVGQHFITFRNRIFRIQRTREKTALDISSGNLWESVTLTTIGMCCKLFAACLLCTGRDRSIFQRLIEEAMKSALRHEGGKTVIYTSAGTEWKRFGHPRRKRPLPSVVLDEGNTCINARYLDICRYFKHAA